MGILDIFSKKKGSAQTARERLQIIIQHQRADCSQPEYIPMLRQEIVKVIAKYIKIDEEQVQVALGKDGNLSKLELNITLPDKEKAGDTAKQSAEAA
jgi:cell division topological specificity factor